MAFPDGDGLEVGLSTFAVQRMAAADGDALLRGRNFRDYRQSTDGSMRHRTIALTCAAATLVITANALTGCGSKQTAPKKTQSIPVAAVAARRGDIVDRLTLTGTVTPRQQATLSSVISGTVTQVSANIGDRVRQGQLLVQIDDSTLRAQLNESEAALAAARARLAQSRANATSGVTTSQSSLQSAKVALDTAEANLRRDQQLQAQGYVSQQAVDQARQQLAVARSQYSAAQMAAQNAQMSGNGGALTTAQADIRTQQAAVAQAQAAVQFVQSQIAQTSVLAPFDGVVTQRSVDKGSLASPGTALVQVAQLDPVFVNVGVPDEDLAYARYGSQLSITVDTLPGRTFHGVVRNVNGAASQGTLSYLARIVIPNTDNALRGGMVANVTFIKDRHTGVIIVPRSAVFQTATGDAIYAVVDGKAKLMQVKQGLQTESDVEISGSGVTPGLQVITQRPDSLQDGTPVAVVRNASG